MGSHTMRFSGPLYGGVQLPNRLLSAFMGDGGIQTLLVYKKFSYGSNRKIDDLFTNKDENLNVY